MTIERLLDSTPRRRKYFRYMRHLIFWMLLIVYECSMVLFNGLQISGLITMVPFYLLNIALCYFNAFYLLPTVFSSRWRYAKGALFIVAEMLAYLLLKWVIDYLEGSNPQAIYSLQIYHYAVINLWRGIFFLGLGIGYWLYLRIAIFRKRAADAEKRELIMANERLVLQQEINESRNAYFLQQLNPHVMFNTLNFVYNKVNQYSEGAGKCILLLTDIQRFVLKETNGSGMVYLTEELEQIQNLIAINQLRYDNRLFIDLQENVSLGIGMIIPLVLFSFTENLLKHGDLRDSSYPGRISLLLEGSALLFKTWNKKGRNTGAFFRKGLGIENAVKRLEYSYKDSYALSIKDTEEIYELNLRLQL